MLEKASRHQIKRVEAEYIRTEKNTLVADLYGRLALRRTYENGSVRSYVLPLLHSEKALLISDPGLNMHPDCR